MAKHRAAIYCRISEDGSGLEAGVDRQRKDCLAFVQAKGIELVGEPIVDNDVSASRFSRRARPGWQEVMALLADGAIDTIVGWHADRLYRRPVELEHLIAMADRGEVFLHTPNGELDLSRADDRFRARIEASVAAKSSDDTSRRLKDERRHRREAGKFPIGGNVYGWRHGGEQVAAEAEVIREMADRVLAGETTNSIAQALNARGVTARGDRPWTLARVTRTLRASRHAGLVTYQGELVGEGDWTPIIDRATWDRLQRELDRRADRHRYPRRRGLLSGLVTCSLCGSVMVRSGKPAYLLCKRDVGRGGCGGLGILAEVVEDVVTKWTLAQADTKALARELRRQEAATDDEGATRQAKVAELDRTLAAMEADLSADPPLPYADFARMAGPVRAERDRLLAQEVAASTLDGGSVLGPYLAKPGLLRKRWEADELDPAQKHEVIRAVLGFKARRVVIEPRGEELAPYDRVTFPAT